VNPAVKKDGKCRLGGGGEKASFMFKTGLARNQGDSFFLKGKGVGVRVGGKEGGRGLSLFVRFGSGSRREKKSKNVTKSTLGKVTARSQGKAARGQADEKKEKKRSFEAVERPSGGRTEGNAAVPPFGTRKQGPLGARRRGKDVRTLPKHRKKDGWGRQS